MLFNSIQFAIFFAIVTLLYFLLPYRYRWVMLLGAMLLLHGFYPSLYPHPTFPIHRLLCRPID